MPSRWKRNPWNMPVIAVLLVTAGLLFHLAGFVGIDIELPDASPVKREEPFVLFLSGREDALDPVLRERSALMDSASLFLPTRWNFAADVNEVASLREETEIFDAFGAQVTLYDETLPDMQPAGILPDLNDLVAIDPRNDLRAFGQEPNVLGSGVEFPSSVDQQRLSAEAVNLGDGRSHNLRLLVGPGAPYPDAFWNPLVVSLQVFQGRPAGRPQVSGSSGFSDWDQFVLERIEEGFLQPYPADGYWQLTLFPDPTAE